jgi:hypothetical protein
MEISMIRVIALCCDAGTNTRMKVPMTRATPVTYLMMSKPLNDAGLYNEGSYKFP